MLTRKPDWQTQLQQFLLRSFSARFEYGELDCCLFVADAVLAMTGTDIAGPFRGQYHSREEAYDLCESYGGKRSLRPFIAKTLAAAGLKEIPSSCAQRGDIVLVRRSKDWSLGFIGLSGRDILAAAEEAYLRLPLSQATRAWRV